MTKSEGPSRVARKRGTKVVMRERARGLTRGAVARGRRASYTPVFGTKFHEAVEELAKAEEPQLYLYRVTNVKTQKDFMCSARDHIDAIDAAMKHGLARKSANLVTEVMQ